MLKKKFYGFVGGLSFLPHCGEEEEIQDEYQFLYDKTEPSEDDWEEEELDYEEDDFDAMMRRKKERREAEIFAWSVFGLGAALIAGTIFLVCRSLSKAKA